MYRAVLKSHPNQRTYLECFLIMQDDFVNTALLQCSSHSYRTFINVKASGILEDMQEVEIKKTLCVLFKYIHQHMYMYTHFFST